MEIKEQKEQLMMELNKLQYNYEWVNDEATYFSNRYHEHVSELRKIKDEIEEKVAQLYKIDPDSEYEVDVF